MGDRISLCFTASRVAEEQTTSNRKCGRIRFESKTTFCKWDIARMTAVQLQIINIISGLRDSKLQVKLLELPPGATLADVNAAWQAYTANNATSSKLVSSGFDVHKAQRVGNEANSTCWKCGRNGHLKFDCPAMSKRHLLCYLLNKWNSRH